MFPVLLGAGKHLFHREEHDKRQLRLRDCERYANGVAKLIYEVAR